MLNIGDTVYAVIETGYPSDYPKTLQCYKSTVKYIGKDDFILDTVYDYELCNIDFKYSYKNDNRWFTNLYDLIEYCRKSDCIIEYINIENTDKFIGEADANNMKIYSDNGILMLYLYYKYCMSKYEQKVYVTLFDVYEKFKESKYFNESMSFIENILVQNI